MTNKKNILITSVGSNPALTAIKLFDRNFVKIIGTDALSFFEIAGSKFCDKFYKIPRCEKSDYLKKILEINEKENLDGILPIFDGEVEILSKNKDLLGDIKLIASPYETVKICNDKWNTFNFFKKFGIPTPKT